MFRPSELKCHETQLISCPQDDGTWPWMLIAKEFARALYPGESPGPLASSLYVALSAPSLDAAHNALDDAGWPRVDHVEVAAAWRRAGGELGRRRQHSGLARLYPASPCRR